MVTEGRKTVSDPITVKEDRDDEEPGRKVMACPSVVIVGGTETDGNGIVSDPINVNEDDPEA